MCIYIYIYICPGTFSGKMHVNGSANKVSLSKHIITFAATPLRPVFKISCLFLRPRPWQFEI